MHRTVMRVALGLVLAFVFTGCQSHETKVANLQQQYDKINQQFAKDCSAEMLNLPQKLSPKCDQESKELKQASDRLQAERARE